MPKDQRGLWTIKNIRIENDVTQSMSLFYNNEELAMFVGSNGLVSLPKFEDIDESFNFKAYLVPPTNHYDYPRHVHHYECVDKLLSNRLRHGIGNNEIIYNEAKETKSALDGYITTSEGFHFFTCPTFRF